MGYRIVKLSVVLTVEALLVDVALRVGKAIVSSPAITKQSADTSRNQDIIAIQ
jgi:hypothetical protein